MFHEMGMTNWLEPAEAQANSIEREGEKGHDRTEAGTKTSEQTPNRSGASAAYRRYSGADASGGDRHR